MAIRRFTPIQDCFIADGLAKNTGLDEILTLGKCTDNITGSARILMQFDTGSIELGGGDNVEYSASLHLFCCEADALPVSYSLMGVALAESWDEGTGKMSDTNQLVDGATWITRSKAGALWTAAGGTTGSTTLFSASFTKSKSKDLVADLGTRLGELGAVGMIPEKGYLIYCPELSGSQLSFFSCDTHTIYKPYLEYRWNDASYSTNLETIESEYVSVNVLNLQKGYRVDDLVRIDLGVRPTYPTRTYTTDSIYRDDYVLPETSYWGIKNEFTNEMVVDFDTNATGISADESGSYFNLNMDLLEPERYYRLLVKIVREDGTQMTVDNRNIFKVVRNGRN